MCRLKSAIESAIEKVWFGEECYKKIFVGRELIFNRKFEILQKMMASQERGEENIVTLKETMTSLSLTFFQYWIIVKLVNSLKSRIWSHFYMPGKPWVT